MIDFKRALLYGLLVFVLYTLWIDWQKEHAPANSSATTISSAGNINGIPKNNINNTDKNALTPLSSAPQTAQNVSSTSMTNSASVNQVKTEPFVVQTDVLKLGFDTNTGDLVDARFIDYPESLADNTPFMMLNDVAPNQYTTATRLFASENGELKNMAIQFDPKSFRAIQDLTQKPKGAWKIIMEGKSANGLSIKKEFSVKNGEYLMDVHYSITNEAQQPWEGAWSTQISQNNPKEDASSLFHVGSYSGAAISLPGEKLYKKVSYENMTEENVNVKVKDGWVAMQQHYFLTAWIPPVGTTNKFYTQVFDGTGTYTVGVLSNSVLLAPKEVHEFTSRLYVGPEIMDVLEGIAPGLELTIDYGWLSVISVFLFFVLQKIYLFVGNWGWSIILVTLFIKLAFYRLSQKSYTSMANMRKLQPKMEELRERFADDKTKLSQATMELYRKEKVNPLGGCLPILVQVPVFIGLYWVLLESVQLRQAPFILWIHDLSAADPYYILPVIMGLTMFIQQKLNPPPPDPTQAKVMMFLPLVFTGLFLHFPAGLVLYWVVNNTLSILQQWYITQKVSNQIIEKRFKSLEKKK